MKKNLLIKAVFFIMLLTVTGTTYSQVTMSQWRIHNGKGIISTPKLSENGDPIAYNKAEIPKTTDNDWNLVPITDKNFLSIDFYENSMLKQGSCLKKLDFTYFETYINIPTNTELMDLGIVFINVSDGARAYIFNSKHPNGTYLGEVKKGESNIIKNYKSLASIGEKNRLVIVQFNSCPTSKKILNAIIIANEIPVCIDCDFSIDKITTTNASCITAKDGSAKISVSGGSKPYKYEWSNGITTPEIKNVSPGRYNVRIEDAKGCNESITIVIKVKDSKLPIFDTKNIKVPLNDKGIASIKPEQISNNYSDNCGIASLSLDKNTFDCSNIGANTVNLTITDKNGNKSTKSAIVTIMDNIPPKFSNVPAEIVINSTCNTSSSASWIEPTATDNCSVPRITSNYKPGDKFNVGTNKVTYTAIDKYKNKTSVSFNVIVKQTALKLHVTDIKNINCEKKSGGSISVTAEGGCKPYKFIWSNGATSSHIDNLTPGKYTATVIDKNGDKYTREATVHLIDKIAPVFSNVPADIVINGDPCSLHTATWIEPTATDNCSIPKVTSNYKPGDSFSPGVNKVVYTATDDLNNKTHVSFNVTVVAPGLKLHVIKVNNVYCMEDPTGSAEVKAEGGCKPYKFIWSNGATTKVVKNLKGGKYTVTVIDKAGNKYTKVVTIDSKDYVAPKVSNIPNDIIVNGTCNGKIVKWDNPIASDNCSFKITSNYKSGYNFPLGTTKVIYTATDSSGNVTKSSFNVIVKNTVPLKLDLTVKDVNCMENNEGSILTKVSGGCKPYKFIWSNGKTDSNLKNLKGGKYTVTVIDNKGDKITKSIKVNSKDTIAPKILNVPSDIIFDNSCKTSSINWNEPKIVDNCSFKVTSNYKSGYNFPLGTTKVVYTATDSSGNTSKASFNVIIKSSYSPLQFNNVIIKNIKCNGTASGSISIEIKGGCKPYSYTWNNGKTTKKIDNLKAGKYTITVTDNNGKSIQKSIVLKDSKLLTSNIKKIPTKKLSTTIKDVHIILGLPNQPKSINLEGYATGGTGNYTYNWTGDNQGLNYLSNTNIPNPKFSPVLNENSCRVYNLKLTVTDDNGCIASKNINIKVINVNNTFILNNIETTKIVMCYKNCSGKSTTIFVNKNYVNFYLKHGAKLGSCDLSCRTENPFIPTRINPDNSIIANNHITIYPNPSNGIFKIKIDHWENNSKIILLDFNGKIIENINVNELNYNNLSIGNNKLPSGTYLLNYINDCKIIIKKLIVK